MLAIGIKEVGTENMREQKRHLPCFLFLPITNDWNLALIKGLPLECIKTSFSGWFTSHIFSAINQ